MNKIKLIFSNTEEKKGKAIKKVIQVEELPLKLESKINELAALKDQLKNNIVKRIFNFKSEIKERINSLESIDLSQKKEQARIKIIVKDNLNLYISYLKRIVKNMDDAEKEEIEGYINRIFYSLNEFNRISLMPFEKATILIGGELGSTRATIKTLIQDINKMIEDGNSIFENSRLCNTLRNRLSESKQLTLLHKEIENNLSKINIALETAKTEQITLKNKLSEIEERKDFRIDKQEKISYEDKLSSLEKEIQSVKRELDLKSILKRFHHDKTIDQLVRNYIIDFKSTLKGDRELKIINVLDGNDKKFIPQLKKIQETLISLHPLSPTKTDKEIALLEEKLKETGTDILSLESNIRDEIKRKEKLSIKLQNINSNLMEESKFLS